MEEKIYIRQHTHINFADRITFIYYALVNTLNVKIEDSDVRDNIDFKRISVFNGNFSPKLLSEWPSTFDTVENVHQYIILSSNFYRKFHKLMRVFTTHKCLTN